MKEKKAKIDIRNRRAGFDYEFLENFTAGIVLYGTEIKSIRAGKASLADTYCIFNGGELYVKNMHIAEYFWASYNRKELNRLQRSVKEKGLTIVPTRLFISDNGYAKLNIALAKGKKEYDKRESIKDKDRRRAEQRGDDY